MINRDEIMLHYQHLLKFALRLTKNTEAAHDLLHDTVVRALEKESYYQEEGNLFGWMSKIMFNIFVARYRHAKKFDSQFDPEPYIAAVTVDAGQEVHCDLNKALSDIRQLARIHQDTVHGYMVGETYQETADKLGIPLGTVRSRLHRARQILDPNKQ